MDVTKKKSEDVKNEETPDVAEKQEKQTAQETAGQEAKEVEEDAAPPEQKAGKAKPKKAAAHTGAQARLEKERDEYKDALIRERADFENYKKRNAMLAADSYKNGVADAALKILPVLDNFERAFAAPSEDKGFADGMQMIMRQLQDVLSAMGVEEVPADGQFDPNLHNAVMQVQEEDAQPGDIVEVLQKGYRMGDKVLRHAMVKVAG